MQGVRTAPCSASAWRLWRDAILIPRFLTVGLLCAAAFVLSACPDGYGYSGASIGYGSGYYAGNYGDPYWGWSGDYYYPGTGYYVYDRNRRAVRWNDNQRRYW